MYVYVWTHDTAYLWRTEENFIELALSSTFLLSLRMNSGLHVSMASIFNTQAISPAPIEFYMPFLHYVFMSSGIQCESQFKWFVCVEFFWRDTSICLLQLGTTDQSTVVTKVQLVETNELKGLAYTVRWGVTYRVLKQLHHLRSFTPHIWHPSPESCMLKPSIFRPYTALWCSVL